MPASPVFRILRCCATLPLEVWRIMAMVYCPLFTLLTSRAGVILWLLALAYAWFYLPALSVWEMVKAGRPVLHNEPFEVMLITGGMTLIVARLLKKLLLPLMIVPPPIWRTSGDAVPAPLGYCQENDSGLKCTGGTGWEAVGRGE